MVAQLTQYQPRTGVARSGVTRLPDLMDRLFQESFVFPSVLDNWMGGSARPTLPANLLETTDSYIVQVALPGIDPDGIDIQVMGQELSIKGHFETWSPENAQWLWRGIPTGDFYETFTLPAEVERDQVQAAYDYGILSITLPKVAEALPKNIKVPPLRAGSGARAARAGSASPSATEGRAPPRW